jgi:prophage regulatory protein
MPSRVQTEIAPRPPHDRLLTTRELLQRLTLSKQTLWRLRHDGEFPLPVRLTATRIAWSERDINQWIARRKTVRMKKPTDGAKRSPRPTGV